MVFNVCFSNCSCISNVLRTRKNKLAFIICLFLLGGREMSRGKCIDRLVDRFLCHIVNCARPD